MVRQDSIIAGTGFVLLTLWAIIFVNILISSPKSHSTDWRKRLQPYDNSVNNVVMNDNNVLVLSTTLMSPDVLYFVLFLRY